MLTLFLIISTQHKGVSIKSNTLFINLFILISPASPMKKGLFINAADPRAKYVVNFNLFRLNPEVLLAEIIVFLLIRKNLL